jgi:hypothetical protein
MDVHPGSTPIIQWLIQCGSVFFGDVGIFWTSASLLQSRMWLRQVDVHAKQIQAVLPVSAQTTDPAGAAYVHWSIRADSHVESLWKHSRWWIWSVVAGFIRLSHPCQNCSPFFGIHPMFGSGHFLGAKWNERKSHSGPLKACRKHEKHLTSLDGQSSHDLMLVTAALRGTLMLAPARNATALMGSGRWFARCPKKWYPQRVVPAK